MVLAPLSSKPVRLLGEKPLWPWDAAVQGLATNKDPGLEGGSTTAECNSTN